MDIAIIFEWFADSMLAAEMATDPTQRELWLRLGRRRACCDDGTSDRVYH